MLASLTWPLLVKFSYLIESHFLPLSLQVLGESVTEAVATLGEDASPEDQVSVLRLAFSSLMSADPATVKTQLAALVKRVRAISSSCKSGRVATQIFRECCKIS